MMVKTLILSTPCLQRSQALIARLLRPSLKTYQCLLFGDRLFKRSHAKLKKEAEYTQAHRLNFVLTYHIINALLTGHETSWWYGDQSVIPLY